MLITKDKKQYTENLNSYQQSLALFNYLLKQFPLKTMPFYCDICSADFLSIDAALPHFKSSAHASAEKLKNNLQNGLNKESFFCEVCMVTANSKETLNVHLASNKHTLRLIQKAKFLDPGNAYVAVTNEMLNESLKVMSRSQTDTDILKSFSGNDLSE